MFSLNNLKIHKTKAVKNICIQEKNIIRLILILGQCQPASEQPSPVYNKLTDIARDPIQNQHSNNLTLQKTRDLDECFVD